MECRAISTRPSVQTLQQEKRLASAPRPPTDSAANGDKAQLPAPPKKRFRRVAARCRIAGCANRPWFAPPGTKFPKACKDHKADGEINVYSPTCEASGCRTRPMYGVEGGGKARFCSGHKLDGMVDVLNKRCAAKGCRTQPSWAKVGGARAVFCKEHKEPDMVDTRHKTCLHPGCTLFPCMSAAPPSDNSATSTTPATTFTDQDNVGEEGASDKSGAGGPARYCAAHAPDGSVNVAARSCRHPGCSVQPAFGWEGRGEAASFCARHRKRGMTDVRNRRCHAPGCVAQPRCGKEGDPRPTFCLRHADPEMVNVRSARYREKASAKKRKAGC